MERPFVYINMAMTVDGKITSAGREYPRFTTAHDRHNMDRLRAEADAILVGAGTVRADNPRLEVRDAEMRQHRLKLGKPAGLVKVLVTASARIEATSRFLEDGDGGARIVATVDGAPRQRLQELAQRCEVWMLGAARVDLHALLQRLHERGVERLLVEGGAELNWALVSEDLADELHVTIAPALLGGRDAPTPLGGKGFPMKARQRLRLLSLERRQDELYCRYARTR